MASDVMRVRLHLRQVRVRAVVVDTAEELRVPSAASNASSPASFTAPSEPTSPPSQPALDIYRNVPVRLRHPIREAIVIVPSDLSPVVAARLR